MTSNLPSNATGQLVGRAFHPSQELSLSQFLLAGVGGALGGSLSWGLTRGMVHTSGDFVSRVLSKSLNGPSRAAWFGANITAGTLGGVVGDGLDQAYLLATGRQEGWNVGRSIFAGVQGAVASAASAAAAWRSRACFAACTHLRTPDGSKPIEDFRVGDWILSRDENDAAGPVLSQRVEEVFVRTGRVWVLTLDGRAIHTTGEHPFFAEGHGWKPLADLAVGDRLLGESGDWITIEALEDTGRYETVYNLRVSETHTYFIGEQAWGWSVWAHNQYSPGVEAELQSRLDPLADVDPQLARHILSQGRRRGAPGDEWARYLTDEKIESLARIQDPEERHAAYQDMATDFQNNLPPRTAIGPGPYAHPDPEIGSIPARGPGHDFTLGEILAVRVIGERYGCHTCGTFQPGTKRGNFCLDHQLPNALNPQGRPQRLYPQCVRCSNAQGREVQMHLIDPD